MTDSDSNSGSTADKRPYLGDPQTIAKLLQNVARETIQCRVASAQSILSPEDARSIEEKEAASAARALLGRDRKYAVDANWNVPGVIDNFLKEELNLQEKGSEPILTEGLLKFVREIHERLGLLDNPKQDPKAEAKIQDIIAKYQNVLLGLHAPDPAAAAAPEAPSPAPAPMRVTAFVPPVAPTPPPPRAPEPVIAAAPSAPTPSPAPRVTQQPAKTVTEFPEPKRSGGGLKWAALILLLLLLGGGTVFVLKKPAKEPEVVPVVQKPVAPKIVDAAPVLNSSGTVDLIEGSGKTLKTIAMKNGGKVGHLYDAVRIKGTSSFLIATESTKETFDLWLMEESGEVRELNPHVLDAKFSPDGSKIAYTTGGHELIVEGLDGKQIAKADGAFDLIWSADNESVFFLSVRDGYATTHPDAMELSKLNLADQKVEMVVTGLYDNVMPMMHPQGKFILLIAGRATGLPSFWKIAKDGGQPVQVTNVRLDESDAAWVPTPFSTAQWSQDGRWLLYDFKDGAIEQIWGVEFDEAGNLKRSTRLAEGLVPRWIGSDKFVCLKSTNGSVEATVHPVPGL